MDVRRTVIFQFLSCAFQKPGMPISISQMLSFLTLFVKIFSPFDTYLFYRYILSHHIRNCNIFYKATAMKLSFFVLNDGHKKDGKIPSLIFIPKINISILCQSSLNLTYFAALLRLASPTLA